MSDHHRGLFHHNKKDDETVTTETVSVVAVTDGDPDSLKNLAAEIKKHSRNEHIAQAGALLGGAAAMVGCNNIMSFCGGGSVYPARCGWTPRTPTTHSQYEKHQAKKDPQNAHKHHIGEAVAGAVAIGSAAYSMHERHDKKDAEKEAKHHH